MTRFTWGLLACLGTLVFFPSVVRAVVIEDRLSPEMQRMKEEHPKLFKLHQDTAKELDVMMAGHNLVPDAAKRRELAAWRKAPRPQDEIDDIVGTLFSAYEQEPPDWPGVALALSAAIKGVPDPRVLKLARDHVRSVADLPDEAVFPVGAAVTILAMSGETEDIELLKKATSRAFVGIKAEPGATDFVGGPRELVCQQALVALFMYAPLDQAMAALGEVKESYKAATLGFPNFMRSNAEGLLAKLEQVKKGKEVKLPHMD